MYAYFDVDERTMLRIRRLVRAGKVKSAQQSEVKVYLGLSDEEGYPHEGTINFIDNQVDAMTGTLRLRGVFPNQKRILSPGMFARIKVPIGDPHRAILVSERALGSDQGQKFLYVVNAKNEIVYRPVQVGLLNNGLRVIDSGLSAGERVVLSGLQRVRPGITVQPKEVKMTADEILATPAATAVGAPAPAAKPKAGATGVASAAADLPTKTGTAANAASRSRPSP
jgi:RND family efflux transporter MFP subunit